MCWVVIAVKLSITEGVWVERFWGCISPVVEMMQPRRAFHPDILQEVFCTVEVPGSILAHPKLSAILKVVFQFGRDVLLNVWSVSYTHLTLPTIVGV